MYINVMVVGTSFEFETYWFYLQFLFADLILINVVEETFSVEVPGNASLATRICFLMYKYKHMGDRN